MVVVFIAVLVCVVSDFKSVVVCVLSSLYVVVVLVRSGSFSRRSSKVGIDIVGVGGRGVKAGDRIVCCCSSPWMAAMVLDSCARISSRVTTSGSTSSYGDSLVDENEGLAASMGDCPEVDV